MRNPYSFAVAWSTTEEKRNEREKELDRLHGAYGDDTVTVGEGDFSTLSITALPGRYALISKSNPPAVDMLVEHPALVAAFERYEPRLSLENGGGESWEGDAAVSRMAKIPKAKPNHPRACPPPASMHTDDQYGRRARRGYSSLGQHAYR